MRNDRAAFLLATAAVWALVAARAALVPWIHDESASLFWFVERGEFLPYRALWDAGNHFLSTAIGTWGHGLWGLSLFGSRIGSVLAFGVYAWAVHRMGALFTDRIVRWCAWSALLLCPFLLDFFSLFRGYGLEMAFWAVAIDGGTRWARDFRTRHLAQLLLGLLLANAAVLVLLPLWAAIVAVLTGVVLWRWRRGRCGIAQPVMAVLLGALPLAIGMLVAFELRRRGALYHGTLEGLLPVTLAPLCRHVLGHGGFLVQSVVVAVIVLSTVAALRAGWRSPPALIALVLWADVLMRIGMARLLGVNYPEDRAALHLVPLAVLLAALVADRSARGRRGMRWAAALLLALPARSIATANMDHTLLWPEQSVPARFLERIAKLQGDSDRPLTIGAYHQLGMAVPYSARLHGLPLNPPDTDGFPDGPHDVRIVDGRFLGRAMPGFRETDHAPGPGLHLLERERPLRTEAIFRQPFQRPDPRAEFLEVWRNGPPDTGEELLIEVRCRIRSGEPFLDLYLVVSADSAGTQIHYHSVPMAFQRARWNGEECRLMVRVPRTPGATGRVVYFWNPRMADARMEEGEVVMHRLVDGPQR